MSCLRDSQDLEVSTASKKAVAAINNYMEQVFLYSNMWNVIRKGVLADPTNALVNVLAADFEVAREDMDAARNHLQVAEEHLDAANEREKLYFTAWNEWLINGNLTGSVDTFFEIVAKYPEDLFAMKRGQLLAFCTGSHEKMLKIAEDVAPVCSARPYYQGMLAFALEQNGKLEEAEKAGKLGVEICKEDNWAHHAVAHSLYFQAKLTEGIEWMETYSKYWDNCMSFMYTHNWFHVALFYLDIEDSGKVQSIFDQHIWPKDEKPCANKEAEMQKEAAERGEVPIFPTSDKKNAQDLLGAVGMLIRWEQRNIPEVKSKNRKKRFDARWEDLAPHVEEHFGRHLDPLLDVLAVFALYRAGREEKAEEMLKSIVNYAREFPNEARKKHLQEVMVPVAEAMLAHARGQYTKAATLLEETLPHSSKIGGSNEQRYVLTETYWDALVRSGQTEKAKDRLSREYEKRPTPFVERLLSSPWAV